MNATRPHSKRKDMIAAALRLFADRGIKATTIRDIAQEAGVTEGALYRHFESKEQLAQSLFGECAKSLYEALAASVADVHGSHKRLCALARAFFEFAQDSPEAYEYVMARHHDNVGGLRPDQPLPKDVFVQVIDQGIRDKELRVIDAHLGAAIMIGMLLRTIFFMDRGMIKSSRDEVINEICETLHRVFELKPKKVDRLAHIPAELKI
ncbi:MAG: TetR family transcriptional regulator [Armatimonadia bacterium]